jgi:uncharacterized protein YndB with AHSA1/START domain
MIFAVSKESAQIRVERMFSATLANVWKAWTTPELLDQWWAPKPYKTVTQAHEMKAGGSWRYKMVGPEGDTHLCRADYSRVVPEKEFVGKDGFCNDDWSVKTEFPSSTWTVQFHPKGNETIVTIDIAYANATEMETIVSMGFKEGFTMALGNLDELFSHES